MLTLASFSAPAAAGFLRRLTLAASISLLAACGSQVVNPVTGKTERSVMDEATEIAEGRKAHQQVLQEYGVLDNAALQAYVNDIGQRLARQSHRANLQWTFTVLDSPDINAFALPGGFVYVTRGILAYLGDEAELAGVLGHEIAHVTARHGAQRATRQQDAGVGVLLATVLGAVLETQGVGGASQMAGQAAQGMFAGHLASYSRDQETQADELGAEYLARNRYNPRNMIEVIAVLKAQERFAADQARAAGQQVSGGGADWLASHPSNDKRLADIQTVAARYTGSYVDDSIGRYLRAIDGLPFGDSRAQGVTRGQNFYHEDLGVAITAPPGWRIKNSPEAITVINGNSDAGLIVRLAPAEAGKSHEEIIRNVVKPTAGRTEKRSFNGLPATFFSGARVNAQGQQQNVQLSVVTGPSNRFYLMQHAAKDGNALQRASGGLAQAEASFRPLTSADRAAAKPQQLRTAVMPRGGFAQLARSEPDPAQAEARLRLLNGVYGGGNEPAVGSLIKVVR